jgi:hypothetical protein
VTTKTRYSSLEAEQIAFDAMLENLIVDHLGQFVVVKGGEPIGFYPTFADAHRAALERFGMKEDFLVSEVKKRGPETPSISWTTGVMFG